MATHRMIAMNSRTCLQSARKMKSLYLLCVGIVPLIIAGCQNESPASLKPAQPAVAATTSIVGDIVRQVAGENIKVTVLIPRSASPHSFEPSARDISYLTKAGLVFKNGLGLESVLEKYLSTLPKETRVVDLSRALENHLIKAGKYSHEEGHSTHQDMIYDAHVWTDPTLVAKWVDLIQAELSAMDTARAAEYRKRADLFIAELQKLDSWIMDQTSLLGPGQRELITDHRFFAYFCRRYGFSESGSIFPGQSTLSEPSARDLARLHDILSRTHARVIFVDYYSNKTLPGQLAADTGVEMIPLFTGTLSARGGPADSYLKYMTYNVNQIIKAMAN